MLKKNLVRTSLFSPFLLLLFPVVTAMRTDSRSSVLDKPIYINWQKAESLIADSHASVATSMFANAPEISLNKHATKFVKSFLVREDEDLHKTKARSASYFEMMNGIFTRYGLPVELRYLAVVESDLKTSAVSRVGAKGLWQFMPQTARDLGLKVSSKNDERKSAYKSTVAAAKYLKDLYKQFDDWVLVIAAYNSGPLPVMKAMKRCGSKNFWAIQNCLPLESRFHVKRFIGIHYYFEGKGSLVTLTKSETTKYLNDLEAFKASIPPIDTKKDSAIALTMKPIQHG